MWTQICYIIWMVVFVVVIGHTDSAHINKKLKGRKKAKPQSEKTKSVSSDRVQNGGRQGHGSKLGSLPFPIAIAIPVIPLQGQGTSAATPTKKKKKKKKEEAEKNDSESHKEYSIHNNNNPPKLSKHLYKILKSGRPYVVDKTLIKSNIQNAESLTRFKRSMDDEDNDDDELSDAHIRKRMKDSLNKKISEDTRSKRDLEFTHHVLSDEERQAAESWINLDGEGYIPDVENAYFSPSNLDFIWNGHVVLSDAYNFIMPHIRLRKRSIVEEQEEEKPSKNDNEDDLMYMNRKSEKEVALNKRDVDDDSDMDKRVDLMLFNDADQFERHMTVRDIIPEEENDEEVDIVNEDADFEDEEEQDRGTREAAVGDEPPLSLEDAEKQLQNADQAAAALTHLEKEMGIDPVNLVSNTHKYVESLQAEKAKYDADIRSHIEKVQDAEKRASIAVHDELSKKSEITHEVDAAKRQLDQDRQKIEEVNTELKELKDIELMATGLEVAKYLATERARHNLVLAQTKASINRVPVSPPVVPVMAPPPAPMVQQQSPPQVAAPMVAPPYQPMMNIERMQENHSPVGAVSFLPSSYETSQTIPLPSMYIPQTPVTPDIQQHEIGAQRHKENRPSYNDSPLRMPLTQYFSNYLQSKNVMENQFASLPHPQGPSYFGYNPAIPEQHHMGGEQRHNTATRLPPVTYMIKPVQTYHEPINYVTSFARVSKPNHVGAADHEITKIEQSHKENNDEHKDSEESRSDWGDYLAFPGTTYSPPPSWLQKSIGPNMRTQPARTSYHYVQAAPSIHTPVAPPISSFMPYRPLSAALTTISPDHQYSQQSSLSAPAIASYVSSPAHVEMPNIQSLSSATPQIYQSNLFPDHQIEMRPGGVVQNYAMPQGPPPPLHQQGTPHQQASIGEVIKTAPHDEVVTINKRPQPPPPPAPAPDMSGNLPGWLGAVDSAKYDEDVSDRLREKNESDSQKAEESTDKNVKRKYLKLVNAENKANDVNKAASALTHIESAVGFDPGSIAKMVDFVKTAAVKDVALSKETVDKDERTLQKIEGTSNIKKSEISKKSEIDGVALNHARAKLKTDEAVLSDAEDRLDKIKQMELIVTEVEVAKFYASIKAEKEVQGAKRTISALKRNGVARPQ